MRIFEVKAYIDIRPFWVQEDGKNKTVNFVWEHYGKDLGLNRYTITQALGGELETIKVSNLKRLRELCSALSGRSVALEEMIRIEEES